jgi:hypothetical protein
MIGAAGFELLDVEYGSVGAYAAYTCRKRGT